MTTEATPGALGPTGQIGLVPERENSAEWFHARAEAVRRELAGWPRWMREGLGVASARLPQMPRECFACGGRFGCRADCDGIPMYASLSEPVAPKRKE